MVKMKWLFRTMMVMLMLALVFAGSTVKAEDQLIDFNYREDKTVQYAYVENEQAFRNWIDNVSVYSVKEKVTDNKTESNIYKVRFDEPGQILVCPLDNALDRYYLSSFHIYSDFQLTNEIAAMKAISNDREGLLIQGVDTGEYYFRFTKVKNDHTLTVYIGFIPDSGVMRTDTVTEEAIAKSNIEYPEVQHTYITDSTDFAKKIDNGLQNSNCERIDETRTWGPVYQFTVSEPGTLRVLPISSDASDLFALYTDANLTSRILLEDTRKSNRDSFYDTVLQPGTYYYRFRSGYYATECAAYLGFIPEDGINKQETVIMSPKRTSAAVNPIYIHTVNELENLLPVFSATISPETKYSYYSITVEESGVLYVACEGKDISAFADLYSNRDCTSRILSVDVLKDKSYAGVYLDPGTYYLRVYDRYNSFSVRTYLAFIPTSNVLSIKDVQQENGTTKVVFDISDEYDPDYFKAIVRVVPGYIHPRQIDSRELWKDEDRTNAIESHEFITSKDGIYTARISGTNLNTHMLSFEIRDGQIAATHTQIVNGEAGAEEDAEQVVDGGQEQEAAKSEKPAEEEPAEAAEAVEEPRQLSASEMRKYIRMLEDQIEDTGLELPDFSADITQEQYMMHLEQVLRDNGYDF